MSTHDPLANRIAAMRRFSRFYTSTIGVLRERLHDSRFSLTESRVLYELANRELANRELANRELANRELASGEMASGELAHRQDLTATDIGRALGLDSGYLSRILQRFARDGMLRRDRSPRDGRQTRLTLTEAGHAAFAPLDAASAREVATLLTRLPDPAQAALVTAMERIEKLLGSTDTATRPWLLRPPGPGDIGWVVARHGALYATEYGFDARFEALVAKVAGAFLESNDPTCENCWIAERDGVNVGSIFLVRGDAETARLRLLLVEPTARGAGIGQRLVAECVDFARSAGYRRIVLWTNDILTAARHLYVHAGFHLTASTPHHDFGPSMVGEDWVLELHPPG